jgi:hypothetical protein
MIASKRVGGAGLKDSKAQREELVERLIEVGWVGARRRSRLSFFAGGRVRLAAPPWR